MNINENMRNQRKMEKKSRGVPRKFLIFQLVIAFENQTWYQSDAKIQISVDMICKLSSYDIHEY